MFGVALIFIIAVMGGLIAYIGDKLGTKVGKRKLSIFGLRPKHTSILVTIITGILIAGSTLSLLALSSHNVRTALFGMEALKAELADLSQNVALKTNELAASQQALAVKTAEYTAVNDKVAETTAKLSAVSDELSSVTAERDRTAQALSSLQQQFTEAEGNLQVSQQQIAVLQDTKKQLDSKIVTLTDAKEAMQKDVDRLNELTANLRDGLQNVRRGTVIYQANEVLVNSTIPAGLSEKATSDALTNIIYRTNQDIISKLNVNDKNLQVLWISQIDFDQAISLIASAPQEMIVRISSASNAVYGEPVLGKLELFPNKLIYPAESIIYSEILGQTANQQQAEDAVLAFLHHVNEVAKQQGILADPLQGTVGAISGAQLYDAVAKVKHAGSNVQLRAISDGPIYSAGPLKIEIQVLPVPYVP
ncbi:protein of unknown function (DUF3084 family) [Sporomusaceae bacterium BoRhaA]|uniref:DUF3084 domain-containing protein n=1 Tax=Pelorhabdus rhamnosifermentans TaxID=2772457 RepID=UPI001C0625C7|nr:DUF3084 domain-containing protein [Pelorhabdus rhamnosifermentans]MBU2698996.1 protein of unknown function (DUF3084 family) [Pelorhabdus rhamnosifermentans]